MFKHAQRICVFAVAATGLFAQTVTIPPTQETRTSGVVGIAEGQTARFNVLNAGLPAATTAAAAVACSAVLIYYDAKGTMLKSSTVTVPAGTASYLDLFADADLGLSADQRKQIRATFTVPLVTPVSTSTDSTPTPVCRLIGTLEILDSVTGKTQVVLGADHLVH